MNIKRRIERLESRSAFQAYRPLAWIMSADEVHYDGEVMTLDEYRATEKLPLLPGQFRGVDFRANKADFRREKELSSLVSEDA